MSKSPQWASEGLPENVADLATDLGQMVIAAVDGDIPVDLVAYLLTSLTASPLTAMATIGPSAKELTATYSGYLGTEVEALAMGRPGIVELAGVVLQ